MPAKGFLRHEVVINMFAHPPSSTITITDGRMEKDREAGEPESAGTYTLTHSGEQDGATGTVQQIGDEWNYTVMPTIY
jgi:hypothetical protein